MKYLLFLTLFGSTLFADELPLCDKPTEAVVYNVMGLAGKTGLAIEKLEKEMAEKGEELSVVLLARDAKRDMSRFEVLAERPHGLLGPGCQKLAKTAGEKLYRVLEDLPADKRHKDIRYKGKSYKCELSYHPAHANMTLNEFKETRTYEYIRKECRQQQKSQQGVARIAGDWSRRCTKGALKRIIFPDAAGEKRKMKYFHMGIALKNHPATDEGAGGKWKVVHMLKPSCQPPDEPKLTRATCEGRTEESCIYQEKMKQFFLDTPRHWRSLIMVPSRELQKGLERVVLEEDTWANFRSRKYNAAAPAYSPGDPNHADQNSNQTILELIAAAQDEAIKTRAGAQNLLRQQGYVPSKLDLADSTLMDAGASIGPAINMITKQFGLDFLSSINIKAHELRNHSLIEIVSVRSIRNYLQSNRIQGRPLVTKEVPVELEPFEVLKNEDLFDLSELSKEERERIKKEQEKEAIYR